MLNACKISIAGLAALLAMAGPAAAQTDIGVNAAVRNDVTLQSAGAAGLRSAVPSEAVFLRDVVRSGEDAALQILLNDETVFTIGANAEMTIDEFVYDPAAADGTLVANVQRGAFRFMSGKIASYQQDQVLINSPSGYIGVRGTMLDIVVGDDAVAAARASGMVSGDALVGAGDDATLVVLRGPGRQQTGLNRDGGAYVNSGADEMTLWKSGTAAFMPRAGGQIFGPFRLEDGLFLAFASNIGSDAVSTTTGVPPRDLRPALQDVPDFRDLRRPPAPGGPGNNSCPGQCPNNQEDGFRGDSQ